MVKSENLKITESFIEYLEKDILNALCKILQVYYVYMIYVLITSIL